MEELGVTVMSLEDVGSLAVLVFGVVAMIGAVLARDRYLSRQITDGDAATRNDLGHAIEVIRTSQKVEVDNIHERLNRTRDDYVKRVDLDGHISRLDTSMKAALDENRANAAAINDRLDKLFMYLSKNRGDTQS